MEEKLDEALEHLAFEVADRHFKRTGVGYATRRIEDDKDVAEAKQEITKLIKETLQECIEEPTVQVLIQVDNTEYLNGGFVQTSRLLDKLEELLND